MSLPKAVLFDLDGVIVDTAKYHFKAWQQLALSLGFTFTHTDNERLKGVSRMDSLNILLECGNITLPEDEKRRLADQKNDMYVGAISQIEQSAILPGVTAFLKQLKDANIKCAICSASKNAPLILDRLKLTHAFDAIVDGNVVKNTKPSPDVFLEGAKQLGTSPNDCVVFEDAQAGIHAGKTAGMYVVAIGHPEVLTDADDYIHDLSEMSLNRLSFSH